MPSKIVDLSARSKIIRNEPFHVHFWECTPEEFKRFLFQPRKFLVEMGIKIPEECRIETTIENHDWIGDNTNDLANTNGTIICNVGGGNIARGVYRIVSYGHDHDAIGKYKKELLHRPNEQEKLQSEL
jgi:hypothetical protein